MDMKIMHNNGQSNCELGPQISPSMEPGSLSNTMLLRTTRVPAKWHLGGFSRVHECDRRHTDGHVSQQAESLRLKNFKTSKPHSMVWNLVVRNKQFLPVCLKKKLQIQSSHREQPPPRVKAQLNILPNIQAPYWILSKIIHSAKRYFR